MLCCEAAMFDERFHTPRASALSSRSNCSSLATARSQGSDNDGTTSSCHDRWHTPRVTVSSSRSAASFATSRSTLQTPIETMIQVHRNPGDDRYSHYTSDRDRTKDFQRFSTTHRRPATAVAKKTNSHRAAAAGGYGNTAYHTSSSSGHRKPDIFSLARHGRAGEVEELLIQGVPIDSTDENGNSILSIGTQNGSKRIMKLSLRYGADIDAVNTYGNTALHFAFKYGFGETLGEYLISKGANTYLRNHEGKTYNEV
eukprot:CCRYP_017717-RB/>CCRYP_017717-RB protein AED:0.49 eAED:0.52 QI:0/0.66/0.25/1/1/1/4/287/255